MQVILENLPRILEGFLVTLELLFISGIAAFILGVLVVAMRISPIPALRVFATVYTELLRNTPLTLVLFFTAFLLPYLEFRPNSTDPISMYQILAIIGLSFYTSPFVAEALRSGVNGVPLGQAEAARSVGLNFGQTLSYVILPQAFRTVIPPLINVFIALTKNTSVAGGFAVIELFGVAGALINENGNAVLPILIGVAIFYLVITIPLGVIAGRVEKRLAVLR
ncbi:MAG: amino acid ABC transporter permease [Microbacteriaceae bacterium]